MAIVPSGTPAWGRANTHTTYGGNINKTNFLSRGVIDALTDVGAEGLCRLAADLEAVIRTAPFGIINFTCNDSSPAPPTIHYAYTMPGVRLTSYEGDNAPTGFPSAVRNGDDDVTFTFPASYSDPYGVSLAWAPVNAVVSADTNGALCGRVISNQTVQVTITVGGVAAGNSTATLVVW